MHFLFYLEWAAKQTVGSDTRNTDQVRTLSRSVQFSQVSAMWTGRWLFDTLRCRRKATLRRFCLLVPENLVSTARKGASRRSLHWLLSWTTSGNGLWAIGRRTSNKNCMRIAGGIL